MLKSDSLVLVAGFWMLRSDWLPVFWSVIGGLEANVTDRQFNWNVGSISNFEQEESGVFSIFFKFRKKIVIFEIFFLIYIIRREIWICANSLIQAFYSKRQKNIFTEEFWIIRWKEIANMGQLFKLIGFRNNLQIRQIRSGWAQLCIKLWKEFKT